MNKTRVLAHDRAPKAQPARKRSGKRTAKPRRLWREVARPPTEGAKLSGDRTEGRWIFISIAPFLLTGLFD